MRKLRLLGLTVTKVEQGGTAAVTLDHREHCVRTRPHLPSRPTGEGVQVRPARETTLSFPLPAYLGPPTEVLRVDVDGVFPIRFEGTGTGLKLTERRGPVNVFAVPTKGL